MYQTNPRLAVVAVLCCVLFSSAWGGRVRYALVKVSGGQSPGNNLVLMRSPGDLQPAGSRGNMMVLVKRQGESGGGGGGGGGGGDVGGGGELESADQHAEVGDEHDPKFHQSLKVIRVFVPKPIPVSVPKPFPVKVPQPYAVQVPVEQRVMVPVIKHVQVPFDKPYHITVEKHVPHYIEKPYPIIVEKHVFFDVPKPYPVHVPIYKHVYLHNKDSKGGSSR